MKIAIAQYSSNLSGSAVGCEMIAKAFKEQGWHVDATFAFAGPFVNRLNDQEIPASIIPHKNWLRSTGALRSARNMWREVLASRKFKSHFLAQSPDLVYVNTLVSFAAARAAHQLGIPVIWHIRELFAEESGELHWPASWLKKPVRSVIRRLSTTVIVNSKICRDTVFGVDDTETLILPNAVGREFLAPRGKSDECRRRFGLPETDWVVGVPGTIRPIKGHRFFIKAIENLPGDLPVHIAITGPVSTAFAHGLRDEVLNGPLAKRTSFLGSVTDMVGFYHACDLCCVPSESETFGRTAVEALATETPLIATAVGGLKEIVRHEENGLLVASKDAAALTSSIERLLRDADLRQRLTRVGKQDAIQNYSEDSYGLFLKQRVEQIVQRHPIRC